MRLRRIYLVLGLTVGYVLGTHAGRERYETIRDAARRVADRPEVQETAGLLAAQVAQVTRRAARAVGVPVGRSRRLASVTDLTRGQQVNGARSA